MSNLREHTKVLSSKNAGPYAVTLDIIFEDIEVYNRVKEREVITRETIVNQYGISEDEVLEFHYFDPAKAIKATIRRPVTSGGIGDPDIFGAQQHAPLLSIEIPES